MSSTYYAQHGGVAVIRLDNPPVNGLGHAVRAGIVEGLRKAEADPAVRAVILIGSERAFSGRPPSWRSEPSGAGTAPSSS